MEPSSRSLYVMLLSNTSKPEFPQNTPASFKARLPYPLRVKNWQVGVAGVYLPETTRTKPPAAFDINRLLVGGRSSWLFTLHVNAFNGDRRTLRNSRLVQADCQTGTSGVNWMEHVVN